MWLCQLRAPVRKSRPTTLCCRFINVTTVVLPLHACGCSCAFGLWQWVCQLCASVSWMLVQVCHPIVKVTITVFPVHAYDHISVFPFMNMSIVVLPLHVCYYSWTFCSWIFLLQLCVPFQESHTTVLSLRFMTTAVLVAGLWFRLP
jgi:hypothetical protein